MRVVQTSYTYWGARILGYYNVATGNVGNYTFMINVDNAARLWVDGTLVVNATCTMC